MATEQKSNFDNILLHPFTTPFEVPPFDQIKVDDYEPAITEAIKRSLDDIEAIASNPEEPSFENTIVALQNNGADLNRSLGVFFPLLSALSTPEMMEISTRIMPLLSDYGTSVKLNNKLWLRIKHVYDHAQLDSMDSTDRMLLTNTYDSFAENGALLEGDDRETFRELSKRLSELTTAFEQNVLKELNQIEITLNEDQIAGLPPHIVEEAAELARAKGMEDGKYLFTLQQPTYFAVMKFADSRDVRELFNRRYCSRNIGGEFDNTKIVVEIARTRAQLAKLLNNETFADQILKHRMAKTPEAVETMLNQLLEAYIEPGRREIRELEQFASEQSGSDFKLMPWDYSYWFNKLRSARYDYDEQALRPYFELSKVIEGVFGLATRLYGIDFVERHDLPIYHPDVKVFEVRDGDNALGVLYTDFFPRDTKQAGAWMTEFKDQWIDENGHNSRPVVSIVMNFTKPVADKPSLLTPREVQTFLHEFGHALHGLFSQVRYTSLSGTSVDRDFVELPSQFNENYLTQREFLDSFARHYETGEKLPDAEIDKIVASAQFGAAYACLRQLSFGLLDMAWHTLRSDDEFPSDIEDFERRAIARTALLPDVEGCLVSPQFSHIFAGGYAAGYYSYKWAEVLDADAFSLFKKHGAFNRELAARFRHEILERGGSEDPALLYRRFRGGEPTIDALLERDGITTERNKESQS